MMNIIRIISEMMNMTRIITVMNIAIIIPEMMISQENQIFTSSISQETRSLHLHNFSRKSDLYIFNFSRNQIFNVPG